MDPKMKTAMSAVLENMGRAAREGKARRYMGKPKVAEVEVDLIGPHGEHMGSHLKKPASAMADQEVDPLEMTPEEMDELSVEH